MWRQLHYSANNHFIHPLIGTSLFIEGALTDQPIIFSAQAYSKGYDNNSPGMCGGFQPDHVPIRAATIHPERSYHEQI